MIESSKDAGQWDYGSGILITILGGFAVDISEKSSFHPHHLILAIPEEEKKVVKSLTESRVLTANGANEDDIIAEKGQGVIIFNSR
jgi:hypothetical protein